MRTVWYFARRNMLVYLKDGAAVFFSLLSVLIILGLYILFLADVNINAVLGMFPSGAVDAGIGRKLVTFLVNSWVMGGIIAVNSVTVTLGVMGIMVEDESQKRMPAFLVSPVTRLKLTLGYILAAFLIGTVLCTLTFVLSQGYILALGGSLLSLRQVAEVFGIILINVFSSTCFVFFLVSFIRTAGTFTSVSIIVGSLIGFLAGVYMPIGSFPAAMQNFIKCLPVFYNASLLRKVFMELPVAEVFGNFPPNAVAGYLQAMGSTVLIGGREVSGLSKAGIVIASGLLFLVLSALVMKRRRTVRF